MYLSLILGFNYLLLRLRGSLYSRQSSNRTYHSLRCVSVCAISRPQPSVRRSPFFRFSCIKMASCLFSHFPQISQRSSSSRGRCCSPHLRLCSALCQESSRHFSACPRTCSFRTSSMLPKHSRHSLFRRCRFPHSASGGSRSSMFSYSAWPLSGDLRFRKTLLDDLPVKVLQKGIDVLRFLGGDVVNHVLMFPHIHGKQDLYIGDHAKLMINGPPHMRFLSFGIPRKRAPAASARHADTFEMRDEFVPRTVFFGQY